MHEALIKEADFQELINTSSHILNNPVLIYDSSMKLLAVDTAHPAEDQMFDYVIKKGYLPFRHNNKNVGYCVMLIDPDADIKYETGIFKNFFDYASTCMQRKLAENHTEGLIYEYIFEDLLTNDQTDMYTVQEHLNYLSIPFSSEFYLFLLN